MEKLYLINDMLYLHVQSCDTGYDYTLYNPNEKPAIDVEGGQLDSTESDDNPFTDILNEILRILEIDPYNIVELDNAQDKLEELLEEN